MDMWLIHWKPKIDAVKVASGVALPSNFIFSTASDLQGLNSSSTKSHITPNSMPSSLTELWTQCPPWCWLYYVFWCYHMLLPPLTPLIFRFSRICSPKIWNKSGLSPIRVFFCPFSWLLMSQAPTQCQWALVFPTSIMTALQITANNNRHGDLSP